MTRSEREVVFRASVYRSATDTTPAATGWAAEREGDGDINEVACLENTETSAIGRALANLGFTASRHRPSAEEMAKVGRARARTRPGTRDEKPLQHQANAAFDVLTLLATCERRGYSARRTAILRAYLGGSTALPLPRMHRVERKLRGWLRCHPV
jgi:hypothetical protein